MPKLKDPARRALLEERRAQILAAAAQVFARKGYDRATIAEIAREAGLAEGSIYNYFKNKGDLLISLPRQFILPAVESLSAEISPTAPHEQIPPEAMLTDIAHTMVSTFRQNAHIFRIMLSALPTLKPAVREEYMQTVLLYAASMLEVYFREQVRQHVFRQDINPPLATRSFLGMFFVFVVLQDILGIDRAAVDYDQVIAHAVKLFLQGARAKPVKGERE